MFQSLQQNQHLYILYKDAPQPRLKTGAVMSVSAPKPAPSQYGQMMSYLVDVSVNVDGQTYTYALPANAVVSSSQGNGSVVVAMTRDAMNNEVASMKQRSQEVLKSVEYHQNMIAVCEQIWQQLNPEEVEKEQQKNEINALKNEMANMSTSLQQVLEMNRQLMARLEGEKPKKTKE